MSDKNVRDAGEGLTDEQMAEQVAGQTSTDLKYADVFQRESERTATDTGAAKASADELDGEPDEATTSAGEDNPDDAEHAAAQATDPDGWA